MTSVTCPPRCVLRFVEVGVTEKSGGGLVLKVAVTDSATFITTLQAPRPEQAPPHPAKVDPPAARVVKATVIPPGKFAEQVVPQLIPSGALITVPEPFPFSVSDKVNPRG